MSIENKLVSLTINGMPLSVPVNTTILEAAHQANIHIPTLCFLKEKNEIGACRICVVEIKGARNLVASCVYPVSDGMEIFTNSEKVRRSRKMTLELILSNHDRKCLSCVRSGQCELQTLCQEYGIVDESVYDGAREEFKEDESTKWLVRDNNKCILCRRCVSVCQAQNVSVIGANNRGFDTYIGCAFNKDLGDSPCIGCGQCIVVCPTGALREKDDTDKVWEVLSDPTKHVIVQTAPSIRTTLGEDFGMPIGTNVKGKMVTALQNLGFDKVFDTDFGADLTIMEEATEFIDRYTNSGKLPLITSCSPGWVNFCENFYPDMIDNLSSCKSPQQMTGAMIKTWYAEQNNIDPNDIVCVSIMPCTAKKFEVTRPDQSASGYSDVDIVLTTRELARMIKRSHLDFVNLPDSDFDPAMGLSTGAGAIFGITGGVMEAALRTAADWLTGEDLKEIEYKQIRGTESIKEAEYTIAGNKFKIAVVSGTKAASEILDRVKAGEHFDFIEVMACPGGCINGGGQPKQQSDVLNYVDLKALRGGALYSEDEKLTFRKSHQSPLIKQAYDEFLGKPGGHKAHELLHTTYKARGSRLSK